MTQIITDILDGSSYPNESYNPKTTKKLISGQDTRQFKNSKENILTFLKAHPTAKLAILYAANLEQAIFLNDFNKAINKAAMKKMPNGSGQAVFFYQMVEWIKQLEVEQSEYKGRIDIVAIPTLEYVKNNGISTAKLVSFFQLNLALHELQTYFNDSNVIVTGFIRKVLKGAKEKVMGADGLEFSLGGGASKAFITTPLRNIEGSEHFLRNYYIHIDAALLEIILDRLTLNDFTQAMILTMDAPAVRKDETLVRELRARAENARYLAPVKGAEHKTLQSNPEHGSSEDDDGGIKQSRISTNKNAMFNEQKVPQGNEKKPLIDNKKEEDRSECGCNLL